MLLLGLLWATVASGCGAATVSQLESGEAVNSGKSSFDSFFGSVASFSRKVADLDSDLFPVRQPLTDELELDKDLSLPELITAVRKRAQEFGDEGVKLNLWLTPAVALQTATGKEKIPEQGERALAAIQKSAVRAMGGYQQYAEFLNRAAELEQERADLAERLGGLGQDDESYELLSTELAGAARLLKKAEIKLRRDSRTLALYLVELALALDTGAESTEIDELKKALKECQKKPKRPWLGPPGPRQPATDDFEM